MAKRTPGIPGPSPCHEPFGWSGLLQEADRLRLWVGLMGDCTIPETQRGSLRVGMAAAEAARAMAAGEETVEAVKFFRLDRRFEVAQGGDAVVSLLANAPFPGLEAVQR